MSSQEYNNQIAPKAHPEQSVLSARKFFTHGGSMQRLLIALLFSLAFLGIAQESKAQFTVHVSGYLSPTQTRTFYSRTPGNTQTDTIYIISGNYSISGKLLIQEGAEVQFLPGGRIVDSVGGKIIANGFTGLRRRIQFRGVNINSNSYEWGHIVVLPGADSVFFANCRFAYFNKKESIDNQLYFGAVNIAGDPKLTNSLAIIRASNGTGGVMTTFSQKTYLYDVIVDSCRAIYRGGAFAFLQAPSDSYFPNDDGRLALVNRRVRKIIVRDTRVFNETVTPNSHQFWADTGAYGGAIYMGARLGATSSDFRSCFLGYSDSIGLGFPGNLDKTTDTMHFERCTVNNPSPSQGTLVQQAYGGAIYVGDYTGLTTNLIGCHTDSAIAASGDLNARGGAIYVSKLSADPAWLPPPSANSRRPGLAIIHRARFLGNVAGQGGALFLDYQFNGSIVTNGPSLNIDGDNILQVLPSVKRDSGFIDFSGNTAYLRGGAIYQHWFTYITGYLAPQTHVSPRWDSVELRVRFVNNAAGLAGGAIYLNPNANPDIQSRRVKHLANFVNPVDPRINRPGFVNNVVGGGAEFIGTRDSAFAVEYSRNYVIGGNGGAVYMNMGQSGPGAFAYNRFLVEDKFVATTPTLSPLPFDPRELTRFCENYVTVGADSMGLFNRTGRGGALFVDINNSSNLVGVGDTLVSSRVRFEKNQAFTGSAIHSDNYRLQIVANQTLVANNLATSRHSYLVDLEKPNMNNPGDLNAGATIWADFEGPAPQHETNSRGNAIYDNTARYIIRLPNGPHGYGGVDTVRGNFWGEMGPSVITQLPTLPIGTIQNTFFIDYFDSCFSNVYEPNRFPPSAYTYVPIGKIPDTLLFEGRIYDIYDRGLDIKTLDYNNRRLAITEAFSLGLPTDIGLVANGRKGIHRWTRDIFQKDPVYLNKIIRYQTQFSGPHPIGYPLFLTADVDSNDFNRDKCARNYTTVFVFNETTQEYVRVNLKEEFVDRADSVTIPYRGRIDFVPDSTIASRHPVERAKLFWSPTLIRPSNNTYLEIARAAKLEDSAALDGRAYFLDASQLQNVIGPDTICTRSINGQTFWYAGERYGTLPVRPGDNIVVFSRTQLWKYGYAGAKTRGITFTIGDVTPPFFSGDVPKLQTDTVNPNRLFLREDKIYKKYSSTQTPNDILFRIGGYDVNNFYDPRWLFDPYYTMLDYSVTFANMDSNNYRLPWWISRDTVRNVNPTTGSNGYIQLYGTPTNPDVVPGGEPVHVVMTNWPPNYQSEHALLDGFPHAPGVLGNDSLKLSMWIYPRYMNCPEGFLPDTICVRRTSRTYDFRIFVQDSLPVFTTNAATGCNGTANLTDSLRYDYDIQTDDEIEDSTVFAYTDSISKMAGTSVTGPWDFRYGRTSYKDVVAPLWLKAAFASPAFITKGKIHVALDSATAYALITPVPQVNGEYYLDTIASVEVDDGHMGKRSQQWRASINVEPKITTTALQNAKEDFDYSSYQKDTTVINRIMINDPNFGDTHTFHLVYKGSSEVVYRDSRYLTGKDSLVGTTPAWLQINPISGALSGVPGINDAPRAPGVCGGPEKVLVVVQDQCGLTTWKSFDLNVDSTQHIPQFLRTPRTVCVQNKTKYCDTIYAADRDLLRLCAGDSLTFSVLEPDNSWTVEPTYVVAPKGSDTTKVVVCGTFNEDDTYFGQNPPPAKYISVAVTDQHGNYDTIRYRVYVGDIPTFECAVTVSNKATATHPYSDIQRLCFGAGRFGTDSLDIRYCEFEVPAAPNSPVFDGRWELPVGGSLKGGYIDIRKDTAQYTDVAWQIRFNSGSDNGGYYYPIRICWNRACFDNTGSFTGNFYLVHPFDKNEFSINMRTGLGPINNASYTLIKVSADSLCLEINNTGLSNAYIVFVPPKSDVAPTNAAKNALESNYPNPFASSTTFRFTVAERSNVKIELYDVKGTLVRTLVNESVDAGGYPVVWDATDAAGNVVANGTYIVKMTAGDFSTTMKMTLSK